jgi:hypothetical protein
MSVTARECVVYGSVRAALSEQPDAVVAFNQQLQLQLEEAQLTPISNEELMNLKIGARAFLIPYWGSPDSKRLMMDLRKLRFGNGNAQLSEKQRATPDWNAQLIDFLNRDRSLETQQ